MNGSSVAAAPAPLAVLLEQFRSTGLRLRIGLALYAAFLLLFALVVLAGDTAQNGFTLLPNQLTTLWQFLLFIPAIAWSDTTPWRTGYAAAMPIDRRAHLATRVVAAWWWTMIAVALTLASLAALALVSGGDLGGDQPGLTYPSGGYARFMEVREAVAVRFGPVGHATPTWQWLVPFLATSALFLIVAAFLIAVDPAPGGVGLVVLVFAIAANAGSSIDGFIPEPLVRVVDGRFGLAALFTGNTRHMLEVLSLPGGDAIVHAVEPDLGAWLGAVSLWTLIGLGTLAIALRHRRDY